MSRARAQPDPAMVEVPFTVSFAVAYIDGYSEDEPAEFQRNWKRVKEAALRAPSPTTGEDAEKLRERVAELETAARYLRPYLDWTIGDESPGYHPTMPSAVAAFKERVGAEALDSRKAIDALLEQQGTQG